MAGRAVPVNDQLDQLDLAGEGSPERSARVDEDQGVIIRGGNEEVETPTLEEVLGQRPEAGPGYLVQLEEQGLKLAPVIGQKKEPSDRFFVRRGKADLRLPHRQGFTFDLVAKFSKEVEDLLWPITKEDDLFREPARCRSWCHDLPQRYAGFVVQIAEIPWDVKEIGLDG